MTDIPCSLASGINLFFYGQTTSVEPITTVHTVLNRRCTFTDHRPPNFPVPDNDDGSET